MAQRKRGFAAMPKDKVRKIASKGGKSHGSGTQDTLHNL
ncbi:MAG TPA: KGG domain-containing protein [Candidatus Saccharimonadales bacterium]|nr:KGG domain-containing protein [Candidatus Saccharimonadales bacterium]